MNMHIQSTGATGAGSGVWGSSTPSAFTEYAIFCVGNNIVREAAFKAWALANDVPFKAVHGCYKGVQERSFIVPQSYLYYCEEWWKDEESVLLLSARYRQRRMYGNREAALMFPKFGVTQPIGKFQWTTKEYALKQDAWTYDPEQDEYFIVV